MNMKLTVTLICILGASIALAEDLTTITGVKYTGVTVTRVEPDGISISHDAGLAKIAFRNLPSELQKKTTDSTLGSSPAATRRSMPRM